MEHKPYIITGLTAEGALKHQGLDAAVYSISYPTVENIFSQRGIKRINRYYKNDVDRLKVYIKKHIYQQAVDSFTRSLESSRPFSPYSVSSSYTVAKNDGRLLSIYRDIYVSAEKTYHIRLSETWKLPIGWPVFLSDFFPWRKNIKKAILTDIVSDDTHFDDQRADKKLLKKNFDKNSFYLTDEGIILYYQPGTVACHRDGVKEFIYRNSIKMP